jgi:hypothetical protein
MANRKCPKCGFEASLDNAEVAVSVATGQVHAEQRGFRCPEHGWFTPDHMGNHSTIWQSSLEKLFPKSVRAKLIPLLPSAERIKFQTVIKGRQQPDKDELNRWLQMVGQGPLPMGTLAHMLGEIPPRRY